MLPKRRLRTPLPVAARRWQQSRCVYCFVTGRVMPNVGSPRAILRRSFFMDSCLLPSPRKQLLRTYDYFGTQRELLEFHVENAWWDRHCAWCDMSHGAHKREFGHEMLCYRMFPGPRFVVDGFVALCDDCKDTVCQDHTALTTDWLGLPTISPVWGAPIKVVRYGYADDKRLAEACANAWHDLPDDDRDWMLAYLAHDDREQRSLFGAPVAVRSLRIEALPRWSNWNHRAAKTWYCEGHVIRVLADDVRRMSGQALKSAIMYGLTGTLQYAHGDIGPNGTMADGLFPEIEGLIIAKRWNCDLDGLFNQCGGRSRSTSRRAVCAE